MAKAREHLTLPITDRGGPDLLALVEALPWPVDYLVGYPGLLTAVPSDILVFRHRRAFNHADYIYPRFLLSICLKTTATAMVNGRPFLLRPGQGLLIFPNQPYHFERFAGRDILWLFVSFVVKEIEPLRPLRDTVVTLPSESYATLRRIVERYQVVLAKTAAGSAGLGPALAGLLEELLVRAIPNLPEATDPTPGPALVKRVVQLVNERIENPPTISELAAKLCMSEGHLRRLFLQAAGNSLGESILRIRMTRACTLLHTTGMSVSEIGAATGFSSVYAFSRAFKRHLRRTPSEFRRDIRAGQYALNDRPAGEQRQSRPPKASREDDGRHGGRG